MITVFTATYNRAYILRHLYVSLKNQTDLDFEWLIIDDGSTDNTKELVDSWSKETTEFNIIYQSVRHGGVCRAINAAARLARTEALLWVGSDDRLTPDAVSFIQTHFPEIADDASFAGMCVLTGAYTDGRLISGKPNFENYVDATRWERERYGLTGDAGIIFKTSVLWKFPSPEFEGEDYLSPGVFLNDLTYQGFKFRWFNHVAYLAEYLENGITKNHWKLYRTSPRGCAFYVLQQLKYGLVSPDQFRLSMFSIYERSKILLAGSSLSDVFQMNSSDYTGMLALYSAAKEEIAEVLRENGVKTLALYGYGGNARRLMCYLEELGVTVSYIIDQNYKEKDFQPAYSLELDLPAASSVCITMGHADCGIAKQLKSKLPCAHIWHLADLKIRIWQSSHIFLTPHGVDGLWTW